MRGRGANGRITKRSKYYSNGLPKHGRNKRYKQKKQTFNLALSLTISYTKKKKHNNHHRAYIKPMLDKIVSAD